MHSRNKPHWKRRMLYVIAAGVGLWLGVRLMNAWSRPPHELAGSNRALAECPDRPNCVTSQSPADNLPPLTFDSDEESARSDLAAIIARMPRSRLVTSSPGYLHAEFRSWFWGFVDDVEFVLDEKTGTIHFRSASRKGHSDLGVNRERMLEISRRFEQLQEGQR